MKNTFEEHPKVTTLGVVLIAIGVVLLLWYLSTRSPDTRSSSLYAHGRQGPVIQTVPEERPPADGDTGPGSGAAVDPADIDFAAVLGSEVSGGSRLEETIFADLNADGTNEALVRIRDEGDARPLEWRIYAADESGGLQLLFDRSGVAHGELTVEGPRLVESEAVFAENDPPCCPSQLKKTYYVWKNGALVVTKVELAPAGA